MTTPSASQTSAPPAAHPATQLQKIITAAVLAVVTIVMIVAWFRVLHYFQKEIHGEHRVAWKAPDGFVVSPGPPEFLVDRQNGIICYRGAMDAETKKQLVALVSSSVGDEPIEVTWILSICSRISQSNEVGA